MKLYLIAVGGMGHRVLESLVWSAAADVLTYLYFCEMNVDPQHPDTFYEEV